MFKSTVKNLTLSYIFIISIITISISVLVYSAVIKNTEEVLRNEEIKIIKKFGNLDEKNSKRLHFAENSIIEFKQKTLIILIILNILIVTIVGFLSYLLAKKNIKPIEIAMKKQKEFISNVSHELKTPITALKSSFEIELRSKKPDFRNTLISGIEEVDKINSLLNGFLRLSSFENKTYKLKKEEIHLKILLDEIVKRHMDSIIEKRIEVIYDLKENVILSDKFLMTELLSIFIHNSVKFNKSYGKISISTYRDGKMDIIKIKDTGEGMSKEVLEKIFDRFYKGDESRNREGHGIGLAIAKEIMSIYQTKIDVITRKNEGTEIVLKFSELFKN